MEISFFSLAGGSLIIFFAFLTRALTGFGSALISVPLLALLFDLKLVVPLESLLEVGFTFLLIAKVYPKIHKSTLLPMIGGAVLGTLLGTYFLQTLGDPLLKRALGAFVILFAFYFWRGDREERSRNLSANWGILAGAGGGILGGLFGTSGPPFVAYLAYRLREKEVVRASLIGMFAVDYSWRTLVFAFSGLLSADLLFFCLGLIPALVLGTILGHKIHVRVTEGQFRKIVAGILFVSGILLLG
ncbi:MAG: hypothetical protein AMJ94_16110 [Deltaproteobacteria bacterium SM23_61]|nr:MAG: hypothetical protein AMJ94_16110 [Deltaproteobacteria bacterium SM23_61]